MSNEPAKFESLHSTARVERLRKLSLTPAQVALETGACDGFDPSYPAEWEKFWTHEVCEKDESRTSFPSLGLSEARRVWLAMERHFFCHYRFFLRVWPEWGSSGIWLIPYPGSRTSGPNLSDYESLGLSTELKSRFTEWQENFWGAEPWVAANEFDYSAHHLVGIELAKSLKREVGESIYVECDELFEVRCDGTVEECRPRLGL